MIQLLLFFYCVFTISIDEEPLKTTINNFEYYYEHEYTHKQKTTDTQFSDVLIDDYSDFFPGNDRKSILIEGCTIIIEGCTIIIEAMHEKYPLMTMNEMENKMVEMVPGFGVDKKFKLFFPILFLIHIVKQDFAKQKNRNR